MAVIMPQDQQSVTTAAEADVANDTVESPDVFQEALARYADITSACQEERALNLRDRRFATIAGAQWEDEWDQQWQNSIKVEVNKTAQGVERIIADYRENRIIVDFRGVDKGADEDTAETLNGMFRADFYRSAGKQATDNGFEEAVLGGIGAWALKTSYVDPYDPEDDRQQIDFEMIPDADQCVFWDPDAKLQSKSDAKYAFRLTAMSYSAYTAQYDDDPASWPTDLLKTHYDWYTPEVVWVAKYYVVEEKKQKLYVLTHKATGETQRIWAADIEAEDLADMQTQGWDLERTRSIPRRRIRLYIMSADGVIGPKDGQVIAGDCIPIVPVYGKRWFVDNMERTRGHVRLAVDLNRAYNAQVSKLIETASLAPMETPILTPWQVQGHDKAWASANIDRAPYRLINPDIDPNTGAALPLGPVQMLSPPQLPAVLAALLQLTASDMAELTASDDGADETKSNVSAEAMDIAASRTDRRSYTYIDNMRQAMQRCGEIYYGMAQEVYVEDLREVQTVGENGEQDSAILMEPTTDPKTGEFYYANDLTQGRYKVIADVTEATATRRDKTVKTCINAAQIASTADPELSTALMITGFLNMDGEGMTDLQAWLRKRALLVGLVQPTDAEKQEMAEAAQQQQGPNPEQQKAQTEAESLAAQTAKDQALTVKAEADTELSKAQTVKALAQAHGERADAISTHVDTQHKQRTGLIDRVAHAVKAFASPGGSAPGGPSAPTF